MRLHYAIIFTLFFVWLPALSSQAAEYIVKKGDTLSHISKKNLKGPIWGPNGNIERLAKLNSIQNIHRIYPGQKILLFEETVISNQTLSKEEVVPTDSLVTNEPREPATQEIQDAEPLTQSQASEIPAVNEMTRKYWVSAAAGANLVWYQQDALQSNLEYQTIKGPSYNFLGGGRITERFDFEGGYKSSPGEVKSSSQIRVTNGQYNWTTASLEGAYRMQFDTPKWLQNPSRIRVRAGVQHHWVPFITAIPPNTVDIRKNTVTNASLGLDLKWGCQECIQFDSYIRLQHPLMTGVTKSGDSFAIDSIYAFDGLLGVSYPLSPQFRATLSFYGQWIKYNFKFKNGETQSESTGEQSLFYSNLDVGLQYTF